MSASRNRWGQPSVARPDRRWRRVALILAVGLMFAGVGVTAGPAVAAVGPPVNDSVTAPVTFGQTDLPFSYTEDSLTATADTGGKPDPASPCGSSGHSVWFRFTPTTDLTARVDVTGGDGFPPIVDVYRRSAAGLTGLSCPTSGGPVWFKGGGTYYFMLSSSFDGRPTFTFTVTAVTPPVNDAMSAPVTFSQADLPFS
jgi:hypothetical protein